MATGTSILAWRIPWREEPAGLQSVGSQSWPWLRRPGSSCCSAWWLYQFTFLLTVPVGFLFFTPSPAFIASRFFGDAILTGVRWHLIAFLICISLTMRDVEHRPGALWWPKGVGWGREGRLKREGIYMHIYMDIYHIYMIYMIYIWYISIYI